MLSKAGSGDYLQVGLEVLARKSGLRPVFVAAHWSRSRQLEVLSLPAESDTCIFGGNSNWRDHYLDARQQADLRLRRVATHSVHRLLDLFQPPEQLG